MEETYKLDALKGQRRDERLHFLPLIIITSNREKELPKPFLRRCIFYYIEFPEKDSLEKIVERHAQKKTVLFQEAIEKFWQLRRQNEFTWRKIPSTSEFLDWIRILERDEQNNKLTAEVLSQRSIKTLPYLETLVKTQSDRDALSKLNG